MNYLSFTRRQAIQGYFQGKVGLLLALVVVSSLAGWLSLYIPHLSISITLKSIPLLVTGFLFGSVAGALNGAFVDLVNFPWGGGMPYSFIFLLQAMSIGFFGGMGRMFMEFSWRKLGMTLAGSVVVSSIFYASVFPEEIPLILTYGIIFGWAWLVVKERRNKLAGSLLVVFSFLIYFSSFGLGVLGSILANG